MRRTRQHVDGSTAGSNGSDDERAALICHEFKKAPRYQPDWLKFKNPEAPAFKREAERLGVSEVDGKRVIRV